LGRELQLSRIAGIDYIEEACALARRRLEVAGVRGDVYCGDVFTLDPNSIGTFDLVYSLGVVEHFTDTAEILKRLAAFVRPGGILLTEVPNLRSIHGLLSWIWQPELLRKHVLLRPSDLLGAYSRVGLEQARAWYGGIFSLGIVAWRMYPRWPFLVRPVTWFVTHLASVLEKHLLSRIHYYRGPSPLAPFLFVSGRKPNA
jgi:2-polyprenyl-6-hydroxyphenyl methylase/3-demethylubiquinone-9 3-methyltransferase